MMPTLHHILRRWHRFAPAKRLRIKTCATAVAIVIVTVLICVAFCSCKTVPQAVTPARIQHDTLLQVLYVHDSIYTDRWHTIVERGDTVHVSDSVVRFVYKVRQDTVRTVLTDSIPYPVEVVREIPAQLNAWQRFIQGAGYALLAIVLILIIWAVVRIALKLRTL